MQLWKEFSPLQPSGIHITCTTPFLLCSFLDLQPSTLKIKWRTKIFAVASSKTRLLSMVLISLTNRCCGVNPIQLSFDRCHYTSILRSTAPLISYIQLPQPPVHLPIGPIAQIFEHSRQINYTPTSPRRERERLEHQIEKRTATKI